MENNIKERLREGRPVVGTMVRMVRNPAIAAICAAAGLDFFMLDLEHGPYSLETVEDIFKVGLAHGLGCFVRVPDLARGYVSRVMDAGANGVMVPMLESAEQAGLLAQWTKYAPLGCRGFGSSGGHTDFVSVGTGAALAFMQAANDEGLTIAQIETGPAIEHIDAIAATPGIDVLLIGPNDLAISLGCPGDLMGEAIDRAIGRVAEAAKRHGKVLGIHGPDGLLDRWIPRGLTLIMSSLDISILTSGLKAIGDRYRAR